MPPLSHKHIQEAQKMGGISREEESGVSLRNLNRRVQKVEEKTEAHKPTNLEDEFYLETEEDIWQNLKRNSATTTTQNKNNSNRSLPRSKKKKNQVLLEGYVEAANNNDNNNDDDDNDASEDDLKRTKSLTGDDLDELKGCLDLGFAFSYDEIPVLCNTLPALELCYSMSQKFLDDHNKFPERSSTAVSEAACTPIANWKISSPGDHPEDVKARLKFWAQAVACTVRLCS